MKKKILLPLILLSFSCLWNTQGIAGGCPKERPFLIREWENENCPRFTPTPLWPLNSLGLYAVPRLQEIPDYSYDPNRDAPHLLSKLKKIKKKISNMEKEMEQLQSEIYERNSKIIEVNRIIDEKNDFFKKKQKLLNKYEDICRIASYYKYPPHIPTSVDSRGEKSIDIDTTSLQGYLKSVEQAIANNLKKVESVEENNSNGEGWNLKYLLDNVLWEKANDIAISEFEKFYTPEKEKQLLKEYEKAQNEVCVGCDYPEPLRLNEDDCKECANREYVDGKCVLKKEILNQVQNNNKVNKEK